ncbi:MAG: SgcJ/EcaC family oxidoreductase [Blastocatellales bacterium]
MKTILTVLTILIVGSSIALGQSGNKQLESEIQKLEAEYGQALAKRDAAAIDRITTDDYMQTGAVPARIRTKAELIERLKRPATSGETIESIQDDDIKVRVHGDTVIATGHSKEIIKTPDGKTRNAEIRWTDVWVKQNGKWLKAACHTSPAYGVFKRE